MKALVLGAGLAGVTSAYELLRDGWQVKVIDRGERPANFTSHANAGLFAPGHAYAWSSPAAPMILLRSLWRNDQALRFRPRLDPAMWRWMLAFYRQCTAERAEYNTVRKVRLCTYSLSVFHDTLNATGVAYEGRRGGLLYLYRSKAAFDAAADKARILQANGCDIVALDADTAATVDPALEPVKEQFAGALHAVGDESGDARLFTENLAEWCEKQGAEFAYETTVTGFETDGEEIDAVLTDSGPQRADVYVLALGVYSPHLARRLGVSLPIYPVKGYSVTLPVENYHQPPAIGGVDEENLVAYCPLENRLRITATAEFSGYGTGHRPDDFRHMLTLARRLFPNGADFSKPEYWAGLRPMTPQGTPLLGRARHRNLWYNTGLGHMGWTMAHGTARITADLIAGRDAAVDLDGMTVAA